MINQDFIHISKVKYIEKEDNYNNTHTVSVIVEIINKKSYKSYIYLRLCIFVYKLGNELSNSFIVWICSESYFGV